MKRKIGIAGITILVVLAGSIAVSWLIHSSKLKKEKETYQVIGNLVEVNGHNLNVYTEGDGEKTLVFLSGGGTCSPVLDFRSLYRLLSDKYRVVVVEKAGYGFSDDVDVSRTLPEILEETRQALQKAGVNGPYILCPHSMSGLEALYWAGEYPEEVEAVIGLDMAVPKAYEDYQISMPMLKLSAFAARTGIIRWIPGIAESDAIKHGTLTEEEKEMYRAMFYGKTATTAMLNEVESVKENAELVKKQKEVTIPMLLFSSNGEGTGWDKDTWKAIQKEFAKNAENRELVELECAHYVHDMEYNYIAEKIKTFFS